MDLKRLIIFSAIVHHHQCIKWKLLLLYFLIKGVITRGRLARLGGLARFAEIMNLLRKSHIFVLVIILETSQPALPGSCFFKSRFAGTNLHELRMLQMLKIKNQNGG